MEPASALVKVVGIAMSVRAAWERRRDRKRTDRVESAMAMLETHVDNLEERIKQLDDDEVDVFISTFEALQEDDEDAKVPFYAAFLDYYLKGGDRVQLRRIAAALKGLSADDLRCLSRMANNSEMQPPPPEDVETGLRERLQWFGLCKATSAAVYGSRITKLGQAVQTIAKAAVDGSYHG